MTAINASRDTMNSSDLPVFLYRCDTVLAELAQVIMQQGRRQLLTTGGGGGGGLICEKHSIRSNTAGGLGAL